MEVHITYKRSHLTTLRLNPDSTIRQVKEELQRRNHFKVEDSSLVFSGKVLDNKHKLRYYNISSCDTLILVVRIKTISITLKFGDSTFAHEITANSRVIEVKISIAGRLQARPDFVMLIWRGMVLADHETLTEEFEHRPIHLFLNPKQIPLKVLDFEGKLHTLNLQIDQTISGVKQRLIDEFAFPPATQFCLMRKEQILKDHIKLEECLNESNEVLTAKKVEQGFINILIENNCYRIECSSSDTVDLIKERISKRLAQPVEAQRLTFRGKVLFDELTLEQNRIKVAMGNEVKLVLLSNPISISIIPQNLHSSQPLDILRLNVCENDTVINIKAIVANKYNLSIDNIKLIFDRRELDYCEIVNSLGMLSGCTLSMITSPHWVIVKRIAPAREFIIGCDIQDNIQDFKQLVADKLSCTVQSFRLKIAQSQQEVRSLYEVQSGGVIEIEEVVNIVRITLKNLISDREAGMDFDINLPAKYLKEIIANQNRIAIDQVKLFFDGARLDNTISLASYGIKFGSTISFILDD